MITMNKCEKITNSYTYTSYQGPWVGLQFTCKRLISKLLQYDKNILQYFYNFKPQNSNGQGKL